MPGSRRLMAEISVYGVRVGEACTPLRHVLVLHATLLGIFFLL